MGSSIDATITAPFNGIVTQKYVEEGKYINPGNPVITLADITKLKIRINASEANIYLIRSGYRAIVTAEMYPEAEFSGDVTYVSDKGDESHNYPIEVVIPNSHEFPLKAGTFVNVKIEVPATVKMLIIPREALVGSTQDATVFIAENGKAILRKIVIKSSVGADLQVISGLSAGEKVVVTGQINLIDGSAIHVVNK